MLKARWIPIQGWISDGDGGMHAALQPIQTGRSETVSPNLAFLTRFFALYYFVLSFGNEIIALLPLHYYH